MGWLVLFIIIALLLILWGSIWDERL